MADVDIVIRAKNGREMYEKLLVSLTRHTDPELYRLIVVDDGSDDPICPTTGGVVDLVIRSDKSQGAVSATNLGIAASFTTDSKYVLVMDNDTEIPEGDTTWLQRMIAELEQHPNTACVGATSSFVNVPQHILSVTQTYTGDWKRGNKDNPPAIWFVSFAVLFRKSVLLQLGFWDEQYNPGNFEDTDYAMRVREAGYDIRVARSVYIHHKGHATFGDKISELMETNRSKFYKKWGVGRLVDMGVIPPQVMKKLLENIPNA